MVELGCRYGDLISKFIDGNKVVGVDIDRHALKICHERYGIKTIHANLNSRLPIDRFQYDIVVISEVLEHLPYPDITLGEAVRIMKPKGKLVGSVPNGVKLRNRLRFLFRGIVELDRTHLQHFSIESLNSLLRKYFVHVTVIPVGGRFRVFSDALFSNYLLFAATSPRKKSNG